MICMPTTTPDIKVKAVRRLGGTVELVGDSYTETQTHAQACFPRCLCIDVDPSAMQSSC